MKIIACMFALTLLSGIASAQIFDYKLVKATGVDAGSLYTFKFDAYVIDSGTGTLHVVEYSKRYKSYSEYHVPGTLLFYDSIQTAGFNTRGIGGYAGSWDVGNGKFKPDGRGGVAALTIKGSRVDPDYSEHGFFKFRKNTALTKKANESEFFYLYDFLISYLRSKGFSPD